MLCCSWGHVLLRCGLFGKVPRQHEFGFEYCACCFYSTVKGRGHPAVDGMECLSLNVDNRFSGVFFVPVAV
jgi:hypothetical protein